MNCRHTEAKKYKERLSKLINESLGFDIKVSLSVTDFGISLYVEHNNVKMRFSDHGVTSFERIMHEDHYDISTILNYSEQIKKRLIKNFSGKYKELTLTVGGKIYKLGRIPSNEIGDWEKCSVKVSEKVETSLGRSFRKDFYYWGLHNKKTGEIRKVYEKILKDEREELNNQFEL